MRSSIAKNTFEANIEGSYLAVINNDDLDEAWDLLEEILNSNKEIDK